MIEAKKSLGQNFFVNKNLGEHIVNKVKENTTSTLVEIGPGLGFFTDLLIQHFKDVYVIEKDNRLAQNLTDLYPNINVINEDFLKLDLKIFHKKDLTYFGSLPYNVSKPIIKRIVEDKSFNNTSFFIIQKEVAQKYIYKKPYSTLSLLTAMYAEVKRVFDISPESFKPKPKVTSTFISITPKTERYDEGLKELITLSFRQPRKNLRNNLRNTKYESYLNEYADKRPSDLSLEEYSLILNRT
jgi:16S rRNA (adenine1518-N6/adenine1519-N6)-dimethyltransferase